MPLIKIKSIENLYKIWMEPRLDSNVPDDLSNNKLKYINHCIESSTALIL